MSANTAEPTAVGAYPEGAEAPGAGECAVDPATGVIGDAAASCPSTPDSKHAPSEGDHDLVSSTLSAVFLDGCK